MADTKLPKGVWIEHTMGECPVPNDTMVKLWLKEEGPTKFWWMSEQWEDEFQDGTISHFMIKPDDADNELTRLRAQNAALVEALSEADRALGLHCFRPLGYNSQTEEDTCEICGLNIRSRYHLHSNEKDVASVQSAAGQKASAALAQAESDK